MKIRNQDQGNSDVAPDRYRPRWGTLAWARLVLELDKQGFLIQQQLDGLYPAQAARVVIEICRVRTEARAEAARAAHDARQAFLEANIRDDEEFAKLEAEVKGMRRTLKK